MPNTNKVRSRLAAYGITQEEYQRNRSIGNFWCCGCKRFLVETSFAPSMLHQAGKYCRECIRAIGKRRRVKDPEAHKGRMRKYYAEHSEHLRQYARDIRTRIPDSEYRHRRFRYRLKSRFGITPVQYDEMLASQKDGCAICGNQKGERNMPVDHDHKCCPGRKSCGKCLRGILCERCNTLVGFLEKNADLLPLCEKYLNAHSSTIP